MAKQKKKKVMEIPEISSKYGKWEISVTEDEKHGFIVHCYRINDKEIEIYGDDIPDPDEAESYVFYEIDAWEEANSEVSDASCMGIDSDWYESNQD